MTVLARGDVYHDTAHSAPERLHTRVVTVFALLTIAPLVIGAVISLVVGISLMRAHVIEDQQHIAAIIDSTLSERWTDTIDDLRLFATILGEMPPSTHPAIFEALRHDDTDYQTLWLVNSAGQVEWQTEAIPPPALDPAARAALVRGVESISANPSTDSSTPVVIVALPMRAAGGPSRALLAQIDLQHLGERVLADVDLNQEAYGYISDSGGRLIVSPQPERALPGRDLSSIPLVAAALQGEEWKPPQSQVYDGLLAPRVDGIWHRMATTGWYVFVEAPLSISSANTWYLFALQSVLLIVTGVVALVLGRRLAATITRPIEHLQNGVLRLQAGHWGQPLVVRRRDEIGQLALAFNAMAQELQEKHIVLARNGEDLAQANRELQHALEAARSASVLKSQFVATISHELRTPLTAVLGFAEMLELGMYGALDDEQHSVIVRIYDNGRHLLQLINDLLDFSKLEAGKLALYEEQIELGGLIAEAISTCEPLASAKGLELRSHIDPSLPSSIRSDRTRLRQIMFNLLSNAVKFTEQGTISIDVHLEQADEDPARPLARPADDLVIAVTDTGTGIAPQDQALIFEDFRQIDASYTRQKEGTGLGLAITRRLILLMGGSITVTSTLGVGSCFTFKLPLKTDR
jgi:signal transduction histidine kinase